MVDAQNPLYKKTVILTGFRDKVLLQMLKDSGAIQGTSVTKNTFAVITKGDAAVAVAVAAVVAGEEETGGSTKVQAAQKLGIPIFKAEDFMKKYLVK
jgi:NAD-dependent DNA ligase